MRYFIEIAYKGTDFHGWQIQPNALSIQEVVQNGISTLLRDKIQITGAGRTDTGVHARQYFAHFDTVLIPDVDTFSYRLNAILPHSIVVYKTFRVKPDAHARFDALSRSYQYHILLKNDPFLQETTWQIPRKNFDVDKMNQAAKLLFKYRNFQAFSKSNTDVKTYNCHISEAKWVVNDKHLVFYITADRFLRNMVRAIVGSLLEVGAAKKSLAGFEQIIQSRDRRKAGFSVPAKGLFLTKITYPETIFLTQY